jgi:FixJ family two-component response regulator
MKPPLIAIAEDDVSFANYLKTFLDGRGYQSRIYNLGEDLLQRPILVNSRTSSYSTS